MPGMRRGRRLRRRASRRKSAGGRLEKPLFMGMTRIPGAEILSFDDGLIHPCTYEETDSYQVTSMFINNREQILRRLLEEPDGEA